VQLIIVCALQEPPILTNSSLNVARFLGKHITIMRDLKPLAPDALTGYVNLGSSCVRCVVWASPECIILAARIQTLSLVVAWRVRPVPRLLARSAIAQLDEPCRMQPFSCFC
jgi:hypothetical protein